MPASLSGSQWPRGLAHDAQAVAEIELPSAEREISVISDNFADVNDSGVQTRHSLWQIVHSQVNAVR